MKLQDFDFRIWDNERGHYLESYDGAFFGFLRGNGKIWGIGYFSEDKSLDSFNNCEIELYTGLKDKNGVKICEGDIVEYGDGKYKVCRQWTNAWILTDRQGFVETYLKHWDDNTIKVIGNIHDEKFKGWDWAK